MKLRLVFFIVIVLGLFIRFFQVERLNNFIISDFGRDILVAKHISMGQTNTLFIRPLSTWMAIPTTPLYFWLMSALFFLSKTAQGVVFYGCIMGIFVAVIGFYIGKEMKGEALGLIYSLLFSFSYIFVYYSRKLAPFSFVMILISLGFFTYIKSFKNSSGGIYWLLASIFFIFLSICTHISSIMILPGFIVLWILQGIKLNTNKENKFHLFAILLFILCAFIILFVLSYFGDSNFALLAIPEVLIHASNLTGIYGNIRMIFLFLFKSNPLFSVLFMLGLIFSYFKRKDIRYKSLFILNYSFIIYIFVPFLPNRPFRGEYLVPLYIMGTFLIGICIHSLFLIKNTLITAVLLSFMFIMFIFNIKDIYEQQIKVSQYTYKDGKTIAHLISHSKLFIYKKGFRIIVPFYGFGTIPNISEYFSVGIWYSLENLTNKQLVTVVDTFESKSSNNITFDNPEDNSILVCIDIPREKIFSLKECLFDYDKYFPNDKPLRIIGKDSGYVVYETY